MSAHTFNLHFNGIVTFENVSSLIKSEKNEKGVMMMS